MICAAPTTVLKIQIDVQRGAESKSAKLQCLKLQYSTCIKSGNKQKIAIVSVLIRGLENNFDFSRNTGWYSIQYSVKSNCTDLFCAENLVFAEIIYENRPHNRT
jgi:hypothetical protein